jgi:prophage tail gpP-like protein
MIVIRVVTKTHTWEINRCLEYDIDLAMDIPADHFNLSIANPKGGYAMLFDEGDRVFVSVDGEEVLSGIIDDIDDEFSREGTLLILDGRDTSLVMVDNDAFPVRLYNINLLDLAKHFGKPYGYFSYAGDPGKKISELAIKPGEREWDVLEREAQKQGKRLWMEASDTITTGIPNYEADSSYVFSNQEVEGAISYEKLKRKRSGSGRLSEVYVHHFDSRKKTIRKDDTLLERGFVRRRVTEEDAKDANKVADDLLNQSKVGSFELELRINGTRLIQHNRIATVIDDRLKINDRFFIVGVNYRKGKTGTYTTVRLRKLGEAI